MNTIEQFSMFYAQMTQSFDMVLRGTKLCTQQIDVLTGYLEAMRQDLENTERLNAELMQHNAELEAKIAELTEKNAELEAQKHKMPLDDPSGAVDCKYEEEK